MGESRKGWFRVYALGEIGGCCSRLDGDLMRRRHRSRLGRRILDVHNSRFPSVPIHSALCTEPNLSALLIDTFT